MPIRRIHSISFAFFAALFAFHTPTHAIAQEVSSPYRFIERRQDVGIISGYLSENRSIHDIGPGGGAIFGGRYAIELAGPFAVEAMGFVLSTDRYVFEPEPEVGLVQIGTADMTIVGIDARMRFTLTGERTWKGLAPFISAGGGLMGNLSDRPLVEEPLSSSETFELGLKPFVVLGVGTRWIPGDRFTLRVDAYADMMRIETPVAFNNVAELIDNYTRTDRVSRSAILVGASYRF